MGYWSALFFEDQNTWTHALADVCSTVVSYGVEIPWCVCAQSWTVLSLFTGYTAFVWAFISEALRLEQWWTFEMTIFALCAVTNIPLWLKRSRGDCFVFLSQFGFFVAGMAWMGCFLETAAGLQGGVVFGGKLFYPSLALMALAVQACRMVLLNIEKEIYGYGAPVDDSAKDSKVCRTIAAFAAVLRHESIFFFALAALGLPKFEQDTELAPWLCVFPFLALWKEANDYFNAHPTECKEANGDIPAAKAAEKEPAKAEAKKAEPAKKDEKKDEKKDDEKEGEKKGSSLLDGVKGAVCKVHGLVNRVVSPVCGAVCAVHDRVAALPWEMITNLTLRLGTLFAYVWVFWGLTEDPAVLAIPAAIHLGPMIVDRFVKDKASKQWENLAREACAVGAACVQYYIFKTNIVQY